MNIKRQLSKVFKAWGKDISPESFFKNYWTYISDAIDGSWGSTIADDVTVYHLGRVCYWQTSLFTATGSSKTIVIPLTSNVPYSVTIFNQTLGTVSCAAVNKDSNSVTIPLTNGQAFQIVSSLFVPSGV